MLEDILREEFNSLKDSFFKNDKFTTTPTKEIRRGNN